MTRPDHSNHVVVCARSGLPVRGTVSVLAALGLGAALSLCAVSTSEASYYYSYGGGYYGHGYRTYPQATRRARSVAKKRVKQPRENAAKVKESVKPIKGPLTIVVSIGEQRVRVFDSLDQVAESTTSTGVRGYDTLRGVFSVIEKHRHHYSNLYNNAPMPYMQRLTWSGTAMHTGHVTGRPASHGCIRLPNSFAARLWGMTKLGTRVIVARQAVRPGEISHAMLGSLKYIPVEAAPMVEGAAGKVAANESPVTDGLGTPMPGLLPDALRPALSVASESRMAPVTPAAPPAKLAKTEMVTPPIVAMGTETPDGDTTAPAASEPATVPVPKPAPEAAKVPTGAVSVFISKKEGKLFVRKGFTPIFDVPIKIANPELPLGTHVYTASEFEPDGKTLRWMAISLPPEARSVSAPKHGRRGAKVEAIVEVPTGPTATAGEALSRVEALPPEVLERLGPWMEPGASITISDKGLGPQTGKGTGFIVLSR